MRVRLEDPSGRDVLSRMFGARAGTGKMTYRVIHHARWSCNGCGKDEIGWEDMMPLGWRSRLVDPLQSPNSEVRHYCAACVEDGRHSPK